MLWAAILDSGRPPPIWIGGGLLISVALIAAGQRFLAEGRLNAPILEITQAADVGMGSFYNHFDSKEALFLAAVESALESLGDYLDSLTIAFADPADTFATSFRIVGRLFRLQPDLSRVLTNSGASPLAWRSQGAVQEARAIGRRDSGRRTARRLSHRRARPISAATWAI